MTLSFRIAPGNPHAFYPVIEEEKELEMLTVASIHTLKRKSKI